MALSPLNLINNLSGPVLDKQQGFYKIGDHIQLIKEAIPRLVFTRKGTRMGNLKYGTGVPDLPFTNDWEGLQNKLVFEISEALALWEPRVQFTGIQLTYLQDTNVEFLIKFLELITNSAQQVEVSAQFV